MGTKLCSVAGALHGSSRPWSKVEVGGVPTYWET
jgi:hypothetical protein